MINFKNPSLPSKTSSSTHEFTASIFLYIKSVGYPVKKSIFFVISHIPATTCTGLANNCVATAHLHLHQRARF